MLGMNKATIIVAELVVGMLIGMALMGCISEALVVLVLPYLYLWIATMAILHDFYQERIRPVLRFDATLPISFSVSTVPLILGAAVCSGF